MTATPPAPPTVTIGGQEQYQPDATQLDYRPQPDATQLDYRPQPDATQLDYRPQDYSPQGYQPPPPSSESRLPWPPPGGQAPPSLPPAGQPPYYGAPVEQEMSDTQRMLQPQGLFRGQGQYGPGQYGPGQYGQGQGGQGQYGGEYQFSEQGQYGPTTWPGPPGGPGAPGGPGPGGMRMRMPRSSRHLAAFIVGGALAVVVVIAVVLSSHGNGGTSSTGTNPGTTPRTSTSASASAASKQAQKQAATQLSALLPQSGKDRSHVIAAVGDVQSCKMLPSAANTFSTAAKNRQTLLSELATLPGRSALPAALVTDLTGAWQASAQADSDLARWANDAITRGCKKGNSKDPNLAASYGPDAQASTDKQAFVNRWNPIARRFALPTYTVDQL